MSKKKKKEKEEELKEVKEVKPRKVAKKKVTSEEKPAPSAPKPKKAPVARKKPVVSVSVEEISLRAYFIAEHRHKSGLPGSEHDDWVEAERQLREEASK